MERNLLHLYHSRNKTSVFGNTTFSDYGQLVSVWLRMMTVVTLVIVCIIIVVALIILIGLIVFTQKHRANKRKRLEGSLVRNEAAEV